MAESHKESKLPIVLTHPKAARQDTHAAVPQGIEKTGGVSATARQDMHAAVPQGIEKTGGASATAQQDTHAAAAAAAAAQAIKRQETARQGTHTAVPQETTSVKPSTPAPKQQMTQWMKEVVII
eukprot:1143268-Pelagomonas_calceolata.AAC.4